MLIFNTHILKLKKYYLKRLVISGERAYFALL